MCDEHSSDDNDESGPLHQPQNIGESKQNSPKRYNPEYMSPQVGSAGGKKRKATTNHPNEKANARTTSAAQRTPSEWNGLHGGEVLSASEQRTLPSIGHLPMSSLNPAGLADTTVREHDSDISLTLPAFLDSQRIRPPVGLADNAPDPAMRGGYMASLNMSDSQYLRSEMLHPNAVSGTLNPGVPIDSMQETTMHPSSIAPTLPLGNINPPVSGMALPNLFGFGGSRFGNETSATPGVATAQQSADPFQNPFMQSDPANLLNLSLHGSSGRLDHSQASNARLESLMLQPFTSGHPNLREFPSSYSPSQLPASQLPTASHMLQAGGSLPFPMNFSPVMSSDFAAVTSRSNEPLEMSTSSTPATESRGGPFVQPNGRSAILSMDSDPFCLSKFQTLSRKQIELFEAMPADIAVGARGRNIPIVLGQVGIRCRHCSHRHPRSRTRGAVYFPSQFDRVYQTGQFTRLPCLAFDINLRSRKNVSNYFCANVLSHVIDTHSFCFCSRCSRKHGFVTFMCALRGHTTSHS